MDDTQEEAEAVAAAADFQSLRRGCGQGEADRRQGEQERSGGCLVWQRPKW